MSIAANFFISPLELNFFDANRKGEDYIKKGRIAPSLRYNKFTTGLLVVACEAEGTAGIGCTQEWYIRIVMNQVAGRTLHSVLS